MGAHKDILARLLPPVAYASTGTAVAAEIAAAAAVLDDAFDLTDALMREIDPRSTYSLLDDFERVYGLPDACGTAIDLTAQGRRLAVIAKMTELGEQTPTYFERVAVALGYEDARVQEYRPWTCLSPCAAPIADAGWNHVWSIQTALVQRITYFTAVSPCSEPLADWSVIEPLTCVINRLKPAHTICFLDYGA